MVYMATPEKEKSKEEDSSDRNSPESSKPVPSNGTKSSLELATETVQPTNWQRAVGVLNVIVFVLFLCLVGYVNFKGVVLKMHYQKTALIMAFIDQQFGDRTGSLRTSRTRKDFWEFAGTVMLNGLYTNNVSSTQLAGSPRLRQLRVKNGTCQTLADISLTNRTQCYGAYSTSAEDTEVIGHRRIQGFYYATPQETGAGEHEGLITTYGGGGYFIDLGRKKRPASLKLKELLSFNWIGPATRVVFLDFTFYDTNLNFLCFAKIVFEFSPSGIMLPTWKFQTMDLNNMPPQITYSIGFLIAFLVFYILQLALKIWKQKMYFFTSGITVLNVTIIFLLGLYLVSYLLAVISVSALLKKLGTDPEEFVSFEGYVWKASLAWFSIAATMVACILKILHRLLGDSNTRVLSAILRKAKKDIMSVAVICTAMLLAYSVLGTVKFGPRVENFSSMKNTLLTLVYACVGNFNVKTLMKTYPVSGMLYVAAFLCTLLSLVTLCVAILNYTYSEIASDTEDAVTPSHQPTLSGTISSESCKQEETTGS